jgi:hypothetical protein
MTVKFAALLVKDGKSYTVTVQADDHIQARRALVNREGRLVSLNRIAVYTIREKK